MHTNYDFACNSIKKACRMPIFGENIPFDICNNYLHKKCGIRCNFLCILLFWEFLMYFFFSTFCFLLFFEETCIGHLCDYKEHEVH